MQEQVNELRKRAGECLDAYLAKYYKNGRFEKADFWDNAEILEMLDDAYENTRDERYSQLIEQAYSAFIEDRGSLWSDNEFNDDIMWAVIAMTRAYMLTGKRKYFETALENFSMVWARSYSDDLGGGLFWRIENRSKNACVNCPGAIAACLVGEVTNDEKYFADAAAVIEWTAGTLYEENGKVYDCIGMDGHVNKWSSTYNQGTFIGANMLLYKHYGDKKYLERARSAASYTMNVMYGGGIMNNEDSGNDLIGFKGILSRWLSRFAKADSKEEYIVWLRKNADSAYANRNSEGLMQTAFATKTEEKYYDVFGTSSAVAVMFNCL